MMSQGLSGCDRTTFTRAMAVVHSAVTTKPINPFALDRGSHRFVMASDESGQDREDQRRRDCEHEASPRFRSHRADAEQHAADETQATGPLGESSSARPGRCEPRILPGHERPDRTDWRTPVRPRGNRVAGLPAVAQTPAVAAMPDVLEASPLTLVRWRPDDVDEVLEAVRSSFAELQQWMHWAQTMPTRESQREALAEGSAAFDGGTAFDYLFRESATGAFVGGGGVHRRDGPGAVEIGYWVRSDRHNRGYATRAAEAMTDAAFTHLADVERIEIHMDCANVVSARIPEKLGYRLLRTVQRERLALGHTGEGYIWELRREAWSKRPDASIDVVPYSDAWPAQFEQEREALRAAVGAASRSIEHIGSTAVPGLSAKPTIDILMVVDSTGGFLERLPEVEALGYDHRADNTLVGSDAHLFLRKVVDGKRTHHLHVLRSDSPEIDDYRLFRDELRVDPDLAAEYEQLKITLAREHAADRMRYVTEKAEWVDRLLATLRERRGGWTLPT